jgi:hypothetical protein
MNSRSCGGTDTERGDDDQWNRDRVDVVAIVAREDALFLAEYLSPQRRGLPALPGFGRKLHAVFGNVAITDGQASKTIWDFAREPLIGCGQLPLKAEALA